MNFFYLIKISLYFSGNNSFNLNTLLFVVNYISYKISVSEEFVTHSETCFIIVTSLK